MSTAIVGDESHPRTRQDHRSLLQRHAWTVSVLFAIAVLFSVLGSMCMGVYPMRFWHAARIVMHLISPVPLPANAPWTVKEITVVQVLRLPRVLLATLVGMGLGISGTALQGIIRNPLVGPDVVGVSSGAAFGGALALLWDFSPIGVIGLGCCGGIAAMACTFGLAKLARAGTNSMLLVLSGIFVGALFIAMIGWVQASADDAHLPRIFFWLLGSFVGADAKSVAIVAIPTLLGGAALMTLRWRLNLLSLGDLDAETLGVNVHLLRWTIIALVSLIISSQVSVTGVVGWVGLVVPHLARMLVGPDHRRALPASALLGALFTLGMDDFTRVVLRTEVPVGVLSALIGTPFVALLLWRSQGRGWSHE